jgi:carboxyl-terminal processing protease
VSPLLEAHKQRSQNDPDYAHMLSQLQFSKNWSQQDVLSLNIEARRARSKQWDEELFKLENIRREKKGLELFASIEAWKEESEPDTDADSEPDLTSSSDVQERDQDAAELDEEENIAETDPMLQEAGYILSDQIRLEEMAKQRQLQLVQLEQQKAS